jgi:outer membrane receptor protein involved in Fe transport
MKSNSFQNLSVGAAVAAILSGVALAGYAPVSQAQESAGAADELAEVTVTGSRIVRKDLASNSPLVSVDTAVFEAKTGLNVENYLNQLPEFNPAASPTTTQGDVQISAVNSVGISSVSLRGFGANRSLVLVDGHRPTPINALMVTDINGIPSALIKRVEIISGGASATYGADAIGGVTNFILRDDFEGLEVDLQRGMTEAGDGDETRAYAIMGTQVDGGKGNITFGAEYYRRDAAYERNHDFYRNSWSDPNVASNDLFVFGYNGYNTGFVPGATPNMAAVNAIWATRPFAVGTSAGQSLRFNDDGSLFTLAGDIANSHFKGTVDGVEYAYQNTYDTTTSATGQTIRTLKWNNLQALASAPQTRYSFFGSGKWDVTDSVQFFARGTYAESKTRTLLLPTNASYGWEANMPYNPLTDSPVDPTLNYTDQATVAAILANPAAFANPGFIGHGQAGAKHPVPVELAVLLNSRPTQNATWIAETYPADSFDQRATLNTNTVWQIETGFNFKLPVRDWTGEFYWSRGQSSTYNVAFGNNSLERWRALVTSDDYGLNASITGNEDGSRANFGTVPVNCTSGFYETLFNGDVRPSDDCRYAVGATLQTRTANQQDIGELNLQGGIVDGWAGEIRGAIGVQYRKNAAQFNPDILQSTASFTDQVIGVYPTGYLDASTSVKDYYAEFLVPVLADLPFMKKVELELGARESDYADTKSTFTYKINANVEFNDWVRLRGGFNRATRAPNLGELFLNRQETFLIGGANFGDPCSVRSNAPYGAGGAAPDPVMTQGEPAPQIAAGQTAAGANSTYLICQAQMGAAGANTFYNVNNAVGGGGSLFNWVLQEGNRNLDSEKANTWTAGFVFNSRWDNPWLAGITGAVDWWKVDVKDAIQQYSIDYARYLCYGTNIVTNATEAAAQAATDACKAVGRVAGDGASGTILLAYDNQATIATSGIDVQMNWGATLGDLGLDKVPGRVGMNIQATFLDYYRTKQSPTVFDPEIDWKGSLGPTLTGTNPGAYSYRLNTSLSYSLPTFNVSLRWRHLPSVVAAGIAQERAIKANNAAVAAGAPGILLNYTPATAFAARRYDVFDLSGVWNINETISVRAGIDNLFDKAPSLVGTGTGTSITGPSAGYPGGSDLTAVCGSAPGCVNPTQYILPSDGAGITNAGFYDTLGRRYFIGLKANF